MLVSKGLLIPVIINFYIFNTFTTYMYNINHVSCSLKFDNSKRLKTQLKRKCVITGFFFTLLWIQLLIYRRKFHKAELFEGILYGVQVYGHLITLYVYYFRSDQVVQLFNLILKLEIQLMKGKVFNQLDFQWLCLKLILFKFAGQFLRDYSPPKSFTWIMLTFQIFAITSPMLPLCYIVRLWATPCVPFAPGFWLLQECTNVSCIEPQNMFVFKGLIANLFWFCSCLLILWSVTIILSNYLAITYQFLFLIASCLRYFLDGILSHQKQSTIDTPPFEMIQLYKKLQLMTRLFNVLNGDIFMFVLLILLVVSNIVALYAFVTVKGEMIFPQFVVMTSALMQTVLCIVFGYGIFGTVFGNSMKFIQLLRKIEMQRSCVDSQKRRFILRVFNSLPPLKIMLGSVNYFGRLTSIKIFDLCIEILANLLLLK